MLTKATVVVCLILAALTAGIYLERAGVPATIAGGVTSRLAPAETDEPLDPRLEALVRELGPPLTFDEPRPRVYATEPERSTMHGERVLENRYFWRFREVAEYLTSAELKRDARRRHDEFWDVPSGDIATWLDGRRQVLREILGVRDRPPSGRTEDETPVIESAEIAVRRMTLHSRMPGVTTRLYRIDPMNREPVGVVIAMHGSSGAPEKVVGLDPGEDYTHRFGEYLAQRGHVVLAPHVLNVADRVGNVSALGMLYSGTTCFAVDLQVLLSVVDLVENDPELSGLPLVSYGVSYSGLLSLMLSALDERIDVTVASGILGDDVGYWESEFAVDRDQLRFSRAIFNGPYHVYFSNSDLARLIAPRPLVFELGSGNIADGSLDEWRAIREIYRDRGHGSQARIVWFEGFHETAAPFTVPLLDEIIHLPRRDSS